MSEPGSGRGRSLRTKLLAPLLLVAIACATACVALAASLVDDLVDNTLLRRASIVVRSVEEVAKIDDDPSHLCQFVAGLGEHDAVKLVLVAAGDPVRIIASNRPEFASAPLAAIADDRLRAAIRGALAGTTTAGNAKGESAAFDYATPIRLAAEGLHGSLLVRIDTSRARADLAHARAVLLGAIVAAIAITTLAGSVLIRRSVLTPLRRVRESFALRAGPAAIGVSDVEGDEIAHLAATLGATFDAAAESADRIRSIVASVVDGIISVEPGGTVQSLNTAAERIFGWKAAEVLGRDVAMLLDSGRDGPLAEDSNRLLASVGGVIGVEREVVGRRRDGTTFPLSLAVSEASIAGERLFTGVVRDITERKRSEEALREAKEAAVTANVAKSEFLANVSHEIRTPMNGVIGMTGLLLDTPLGEEQREYATTVRQSAEALLSIINDLLDFSKIEAGRLDLEETDFHLRAAMEDAVELMAAEALRKGLEIGCVLDQELPALVCGDPGRLRQILLNLVANAVKFTDRGGVVVRARWGIDAPDRERVVVRFEIADSGVGIAPEALDRLFIPFSQADGSTTRRYGGTGLGLSISKRLAELMGGTIGVESVVGRGSTFWFTIAFRRAAVPDAPVPAADGADAPLRDAMRFRALCVDDEDLSRAIHENQLRSAGAEVETAADGPSAIARLRSAATAGSPFRIALLDLRMPGMDGIALARVIRGDTALDGVRVVMVATQPSRREREAAIAAGAAAVLSRPVRLADLERAIRRALGAGAEPPPSEDAAPPAAADRNSLARPGDALRERVLVVEDNSVNQKLALALLAKLGLRGDAVGNGAEALVALTRVPYAAVLMDCQMPVMDGFEATRAIRSRESGERRLPIIAMTANSMEGDRERCLAAGMDDYVGKPVQMERLRDAIERRIGARTLSEPSPATPAPPASNAAATTAAVDSEFIESLRRDLSQEGEADPVTELIDLFLDTAREKCRDLKDALRRGDGGALEFAAHALKGSSSSLGAFGLSKLCEKLQSAGHQGEIVAATPLVGEVDRELTRVRAALQPLRR